MYACLRTLAIFFIGMPVMVTANGPAIWGGCVTWCSHPVPGPGALAEKLSRWQDRYGVLFVVWV
ncbi:MAG: hypothetical protein JXR54_05615 [Tannerellaceae bacterium]|nr:hypothetical protein [Tannerellaceae bacterium]